MGNLGQNGSRYFQRKKLVLTFSGDAIHPVCCVFTKVDSTKALLPRNSDSQFVKGNILEGIKKLLLTGLVVIT